MPSQTDLRALFNLIEQAYIAMATDPIPVGGIESARENLKAAVELARLLKDQK
jgi:hypothetical protein